jgi:8-oxo-dGTP diphosphatase
VAPDIYKAAGIIIKNRCLLVARSKDKDMFFALGGKIEAGETPKQAVVRELKEELQINVDQNGLTFFGEYIAEAAGDPGRQVRMVVFLVGAFTGTIRPDNEIAEVRWLTSHDHDTVKIGSIFEHKVMPRLKAANLID